MNDKKYWSVKQLIADLGEGSISKSFVYSAIKAGLIPSIKLGKRVFIPDSWVQEFYKGNINF